MSQNYPFSHTSSKKHKTSAQLVYEKSAIQATPIHTINPAEYKHILQGDRILVELYIQNQIAITEYNKFIEVMGATVYKRIHPKVNIALTNL